jgi:RNase H-fold protein (predicted Holliday junction resolvase)
MEQIILGFDPGKDKCGLAVMAANGQLYAHEVVPAATAIDTIENFCQQWPIATLVMGNQTTSKSWQQKLSAQLTALSIVLVDERYTTLAARDRYWQMYPPKGLQRLLPQGLRQPPRPVDDIVAILLIERYLEGRSSGVQKFRM